MTMSYAEQTAPQLDSLAAIAQHADESLASAETRVHDAEGALKACQDGTVILESELKAQTVRIETLTTANTKLLADKARLIARRNELAAALKACKEGVTEPDPYRLLVGVTPGPDNTESYMMLHEQKAGRVLDCRRTFETNIAGSTFAQTDAGSDVGKGRMSVQSWKQNCTQEQATTFYRTVPQTHRVITAYWHEWEDDFTTTAALDEITRRNEKFRLSIDAANVDRDIPIEFWGIAMAYLPDRYSLLASRMGGIWEGMAFDGYAWATDKTMRPARDIFAEDVARARQLGFTRIGVGEFGNQWGTTLHNPPQVVDISDWITAALTYFRSEKVVFASYFNKNLTMSRDTEYQALGAV